MQFSEKIKRLRTNSHMTQEELAEKLFVTRTAVSKWETNKGLPGIDTLKLIAELFGISLDELISDDDIQTQRTRDKKRMQIFLWCAFVCFAIAAVFGILCCFLKNRCLVIGMVIGVVGYSVFALLFNHCGKHLQIKKSAGTLIVPIMLLAVIVVAAVTSLTGIG